MQLTLAFLVLLQEFAPVFTKPSFETFKALLTGWCLSFRHRFITELILSSDSIGEGHYSCYHRFFSQACWSMDTFWCYLARLLLTTFAPTGLVTLAGDDTLCRKRGLTIYGGGMHHDPLLSSRALKVMSWGHDWVVLGLLVRCPWAPSKVWCLPLLARLYRNRQGLAKGRKGQKRPRDPQHRTRPELFREMLQLLANWFPERQFLVSGDSAYGGKSVLRQLPANVDLISHVHPKGALYEPAPPRQPGQKGAGRKKGARLPTMAAWAADARQPWTELQFDQFGLHATLQVKTRQALYYKAGGQRLLTIVLVHDGLGQRPDQMFYCTRLDWEAQQILSCYAARWAIEVTFENSKQLLGLAEPANRKPLAVARTAPMALVLYSLIVVWFHRVGHLLVQYPERPWYRGKSEPSFADMLSTLRRVSWEEKTLPLLPKHGVLKMQVVRLLEFVSRAG
jgi:DDE superfamily endonuclease